MREFVMDTETTGFDPESGDRLCEIACVELANYIPTGRVYHQYINPERDMPEGAFRVHGLSTEFLRDKPVFADVVQDFLEFVGDGLMIFHNASFDMKFINAELKLVGIDAVPGERVFDTLALARRKHPAGPNSLDALCKRYSIDNSARTKHGALLDAELLAEVYLELVGGKQAALDLSARRLRMENGKGGGSMILSRPRPLPVNLIDAERNAHQAFIDELGEDAVWRQYQ
ncbi:MAG: DNA polymerase III subunit epsilon [Rhodomicrobiaceae bacterium]